MCFKRLLVALSVVFLGGIPAAMAEIYHPPKGCRLDVTIAYNTCQTNQAMTCKGRDGWRIASLWTRDNKPFSFRWYWDNQIYRETLDVETGKVKERTYRVLRGDPTSVLREGGVQIHDYKSKFHLSDGDELTDRYVERSLTGKSRRVRGGSLLEVKYMVRAIRDGQVLPTLHGIHLMDPVFGHVVFNEVKGQGDPPARSTIRPVAIAYAGDPGFGEMDGCKDIGK